MTSPATVRAAPRVLERERWRMGAEARSVVFISSCLLLVGLAVLYSASAIVATAAGRPGWYFLANQGIGALVHQLHV